MSAYDEVSYRLLLAEGYNATSRRVGIRTGREEAGRKTQNEGRGSALRPVKTLKSSAFFRAFRVFRGSIPEFDP